MEFPQTEWSLILQASLSGDDSARAALEELCQRYWPVVRDFLQRRGMSPEDAEDVTQEFFAGIARSGALHRADRELGRFRSFLLGSLERKLAEWYRYRNAQKRGGGVVPVRLDHVPEGQQAIPASDEVSFDVAWAERVLEMGLGRLEREYAARERMEEFAVMVPFLSAAAGQALQDAAALKLGVGEGAMKSRIFRLRQRYRDCVLEEITATVATPHEAEEEMAYLFRVISARGGGVFPDQAAEGRQNE